MKYYGLLISGALAMASQSAIAATLTTLIDNGSSTNRVDVVFLGDGYTSADLAAGTYDAHIGEYLDYWFSDAPTSDPFYRYRNYFNTHKVDVISNESGADNPAEGIIRRTALDARYYFDGMTEQLLYINENKANAILAEALLDASFAADIQYVTVNETTYGGGSSAYSVFSGGNGFSQELALHELAHSFSNLADEYGGFAQPYTGAEPVEVNVTTDPTGAKWSHWHGYDQPGVGVIGAYEGARYYDQGLYRPAPDSKLRSLGQPFDVVAREQLILDIYALVDPLDAWLDNSVPLLDPDALFVDVVDEAVISLEWFVDDVQIPLAETEIFDLRSFGYGPGDYTVTARAFDPTGFDPVNGWVRINQDWLEQFVSWEVSLSALSASVVSIPEPSAWLPWVLLPLWFAKTRRQSTAREE